MTVSERLHPACLPADTLLSQCDERRLRTSGPGGQHRNKVETAVVLKHRPTGLVGAASERRAQGENRRMALRRLRLALATEIRSAEPRGEPSALWRSRCPKGRIACNPRHEDFPALLAEALDVLTACDWHPGPAGEALGCSGSQLTRFVREHRPAWEHLNRARTAAGLGRLR